MRTPLALAAVALVACGCGQTPTSIGGHQQRKDSGQEVNLDPSQLGRERSAARARLSQDARGAHPQVVVAVRPGDASVPDPTPKSSGTSSRIESDAQIRKDLEGFRKYLATIPPTTGKRAEVISSGEAAAPFDAPQTVIQVVQAANEIARTPYRWGGGHSAWRDKGYDCSGSVSFALAAAGLLDQPLDSTRFERYGAAGPGRWITIYANATHAWMTVAGLRFDTGGLSTGTRWQAAMRSTSGFVQRHPPGL